MKLMKKLFWLPVMLLTMMLCPIHAAGQGTINIQLEQPLTANASINNVIFGVVQVGAYNAENGTWTLTDSFASSQIDLNTINTPEQLQFAANTLEALAKKNSASTAQYSTNAAGSVSISNLDDGIYLIYPIDDKNYDIIQATLVELPQYDENTEQMRYEITVYPKHAKRNETPKPVTPAPQNPSKNPTQSGSGTQTATETNYKIWILAAGMVMLACSVMCFVKAKTE